MAVAKTKAIGIIDFINNLTINKIPWSTYTESERKVYSPYMINKWISMNTDCLELINMLQQYTVSLLTPEQSYNILLNTLPKKKIYLRYIKGKDSEKFNKELVEYIAIYYECSLNEAIDYLQIYYNNPQYILEVKTILKKYGLEDKKIATLIKMK